LLKSARGEALRAALYLFERDERCAVSARVEKFRLKTLAKRVKQDGDS